MNSDVKWFNPRQIPNEKLLILATGRKKLLGQLFNTIEKNLKHDGSNTQWLMTGTRGSGKSFFLRLAQIHIEQQFNNVRFALLPEELENVFAPHELLDEIRRLLQNKPPRNADWNSQESDKKWQASLSKLLASFDEKLLIVAIENFGTLLKNAFDDEADAALLRKLLTGENRIMFLVTDVDGTFDKNYNKRLFEQFEAHPIPPWNKEDHRYYLTKRANLENTKINNKQLAKIDAYSRYTGGNPRVAAILAAAILDEQNLVSSGKDLNTALDKVSDYYRALLKQLPNKSRRLFHALVNGKEPCSQTELANRVGATQNQISQAFKVLMAQGFLRAKQVQGKKATYYQVIDRLFVQWYRMRYIEPEQNSHLAVMTNLLTDMIDFKGKLDHAQQLSEKNLEQDADFLIDLALQERKIDIAKITGDLSGKIKIGRQLSEFEKLHNQLQGKSELSQAIYILSQYPSDQQLFTVIKKAKSMFEAHDSFDGKELARLIDGSFSLDPWEKFRTYISAIQPDFLKFQWDSLIELYNEETETFKQLAKKHPAEIKQLTNRNKQYAKYPWQSFWDYDFTFKIENLNKAEQNLIKASMLAMALLGREKNKKLPFDRNINHAFYNLLREVHNKHGLFKESSTLLKLFLTRCTNSNPAFSDPMMWFLRNEAELSSSQSVLEICQANLANKDLNKKIQTVLLKQQGWNYGVQMQWQNALGAHLKALEINKQDEWSIGQVGRYHIVLSDFDKAWSFIKNYLTKDAEKNNFIILQLADSLWDVQKQQGKAFVYGAGRELLYQLSTKPDLDMQSITRLIFIYALDTGVELGVLIDLATDLPTILQNTNPEEKQQEISYLSHTLIDWFSYLQLSTKERTKKQQLMEPDWQTTLEGLNNELYIRRSLQLKLTKPAKIGSETKENFKIICTLMEKSFKEQGIIQLE